MRIFSLISSLSSLLGALAALGAPVASAAPGASAPLRVFIRAGAKTHGPGAHDWPRFLAEWRPLLAARGATVEGAQRFPTADELARTDVVIFGTADGGSLAPDERARFRTFLERGGGVVVLHDGVVANDPAYWTSIVGGAFEKGRSKWYEGKVGFYFDNGLPSRHPITAGAANFFMDDEIYWDIHLAKGVNVLATGFRTVQEITPQIWTYEPGRHRAFVSIPGHLTKSFSEPHYRALVLRGVAWAGRRPVDALTRPDEVAALRYPPGGPTPPARAAAAIKVQGDFDLRLVAAEPDVVKPVSLDWDARGRLWVLQMPQYPEKAAGKTGADSVVILEDTNGDGAWDKRRVFCDGLNIATSFAFHRDGVVVTQPPEILFLRDTDGDDRCDQRDVLYSGFGLFDTHAVISNLRWGPDGWLYATQGYSGGDSKKIVGKEGRAFGQIGNGLLRFKPDGTAIEVVSAYGANTWGLDFTWDNEIVFTMANGSHLRHVVLPERVLARGKLGQTPSWKDVTNHHEAAPLVHHTLNPYVQIDHVGGFTAASGSTVYAGGAWPAEWNGVHFVSEPTINLVHTDVLAPGGATLASKKLGADEFIGSRDLWFRPVETRVGPDGALYVGDWYNLAAVHNDTRGPPHGPNNAARRPDRDHAHGRVWRVQHKRATALAQPALARASAAELVAALEHPNRWQRMTAHRLLLERREGAAEAKALLSQSTHAFARVHALWLRHDLDALGADELVRALEDSDAGVRKNAARLAGLRAPDERAPALNAALLRRLGDADGRARVEAIVALGARPPARDATTALVAAFVQKDDPWSQSAIVGALAGGAVDAVATALARGEPKLRPLIEELTTLVAERQGAAGISALLARVARARGGSEASSELRAAALARLARAPKLESAPALSGEARSALSSLVAAREVPVASAALAIVARWPGGPEALAAPLKGAATRLAATAGDAKQPARKRLAAVRGLLAVSSQRQKAFAQAGHLLEAALPADAQSEIIEALAQTASPEAAKVIVAAFARLGSAARDAALGHLLGRAPFTEVVLAEIEATRLRPLDLGPAALFRMRTLPDKALAKRAGQVLDAVLGEEAKEKDAVIAKLLPVVSRSGNGAAGREAFTKNCLVCHSYKGEGTGFAPDLAGMGARGPAELLVHIIDPNRHVEPNFIAYDLATKSGTNVNGILVRETPEAVVLRNANGQTEVKRTDVASLSSSGLSLMPTGFEALGPDVLRDILTYLCGDAGRFRTLDLAPLANASTRRGLYNRGDGKLRLQAFGTQTVDDVVFELVDPGKNPSGNNAVVLGPAPDDAPTVDVRLGFPVAKLHVLGGIAAAGRAESTTAVAASKSEPIAKVVYHYADGRTEEKLLRDGVEFATWKARVDVPGSRFVSGLLPEGVPGQLRRFSVTPARRDPVEKVTLEGVGGKQPTFLALTAELPGEAGARAAGGGATGPHVLLVGGGASHDFDRWWKGAEIASLGAAKADARYTAAPAEVAPALGALDVLYLANNQPLADPAARSGIFEHVSRGRGLLIGHAAAWYNWKDWPEYNRALVGGGASSHEKYGEFEVTVVERDHPLMKGLPGTFRIKDELYRFTKDPQGPAITVLATGKSLATGAEYPVVWTVQHASGRIACMTLGHDGAAHELPAYKTILANALRWLAKR